MSWIEQLMPNEYVTSIYNINLDKLWSSGKKLILTDLDNTLVPWNDEVAPPKLVHWLQEARKVGFSVCILSNNKGHRVAHFSVGVGIPAISKAKKPKPRAFREALSRFGAREDEAVMVGDQLLTDIWGGNISGFYTILVLPIHSREWWGTRLNRQVERLLLKRLIRRGLVVPSNR